MLGPALFRLSQAIIMSATAAKPSLGKKKDGAAAAAKEAADGIAPLAADGLLLLLTLAAETQRMPELLQRLPLPSGSSLDADQAAADALTAHVTVRLPLFHTLLHHLFEQSCFREAQTIAECLNLLGGLIPGNPALQISHWAYQMCEMDGGNVNHPGKRNYGVYKIDSPQKLVLLATISHSYLSRLLKSYHYR